MKKKLISMTEYNNIMSDIIKKGHPVSDTLVELLEEASKYRLPKATKRVKKKRKISRVSLKEKRQPDKL